MEAYFDGLRVFQSPDNDIMVIRDERPVMHIACTKQLKKRELIQTVRELSEMVIAERKARNRMNLYSAVCPICGKINQNLLLEETEGTMECESCGSVVNVLGMEDGNAIPILTKELCASIMARAAV